MPVPPSSNHDRAPSERQARAAAAPPLAGKPGGCLQGDRTPKLLPRGHAAFAQWRSHELMCHATSSRWPWLLTRRVSPIWDLPLTAYASSMGIALQLNGPWGPLRGGNLKGRRRMRPKLHLPVPGRAFWVTGVMA
jgi:hypothetical protein